MIEPAALIANAREWVGVPYLHQGRTRHGCDCLGFIAACLAELGSTVFLDNLPTNYARDPQSILIDGLGTLTHEIPIQPGAFLLFKFPKAQHPSHGAIFTGTSMIHSYQGVGQVVEHSFGDPWVRRMAGVYALPMVNYQAAALARSGT